MRTQIGRIMFGSNGISRDSDALARHAGGAYVVCSDPTLRGLPTMPVVYHVCDTCAPAIMNDDYSAFDQQDVDTDYERFAAFVENVGYLTDAGMVNKAGYWECESCAQVCIGSAYALETV